MLKVKAVDGIDRNACSNDVCTFVFWDNPTPVVAIVVEVEGGILLAHNKSWPSGIFSLITGFLEAKESPESACVRELKEELGLDANVVQFLGNFSFPRFNQLMIAFHVKASGSILLNEELDDYIIVARERLKGWSRNQRFEVGEWLESLRVLDE